MAAPLAAAAKALATTFGTDPGKMVKIILAAFMLPLCLVVFLFSVVPGASLTVPNVTPAELSLYKSICDQKAEEVAKDIIENDRGGVSEDRIIDTKYQYIVQYKYLMAIDAVRYKQNFSKASKSSIRRLLDRFYIVSQEQRSYYTVKTDKDGNVIRDKFGNVETEEHTYTVNVYTIRDFNAVVNELIQTGEVKDSASVNNYAMSGFENFFADGEFNYTNDKPDYNMPANIKIDPSEMLADVPYFSQLDGRWAKLPYGSASMANSACGPTSAAMIINALHGYNERIDANKDNIIDPYEAACYSVDNGFRITGQGTAWNYFSSIGKACGLTVVQCDPSGWKSVKNALQNGDLVIASMGPGVFTSAGHFIVLSGVDSSGMVIVNDPASVQRSNQHWGFSNPILSQAKQFWVITR